MTNQELRRTLEAVANRLQVIVGLTIELRQSVNADVEKVIALEGAVNGVVRLLRGVQPQKWEGA